MNEIIYANVYHKYVKSTYYLPTPTKRNEKKTTEQMGGCGNVYVINNAEKNNINNQKKVV